MREEGKLLKNDRRKFPRLEDSIFISYSLKSMICKAITENISGGGLMFESEARLPEGSALTVEVYQPVNSFKTLIHIIPVLTKVMWVKRIKYDFMETGENQYKIGVAFTEISEENREKIVDYTRQSLS